ncbi:hypothetical protein GOZ94_27155, partial [Agrobacterium vitis]|uniref:OsmC family protein n=1 Tax=Agrobacterium vitis TaxID=373 RepID=UPI00132893AC
QLRSDQQIHHLPCKSPDKTGNLLAYAASLKIHPIQWGGDRAYLSACHMLWYLHYASDAGIIVTRYEDTPLGVGAIEKGGAGRFTAATLRPRITVFSGTDIEAATAIHHKIHEVCFIARSVNFPISYEPDFLFEA